MSNKVVKVVNSVKLIDAGGHEMFSLRRFSLIHIVKQLTKQRSKLFDLHRSFDGLVASQKVTRFNKYKVADGWYIYTYDVGVIRETDFVENFPKTDELR